MYKLLSVWALVLLSVQIVHSWDLAVAVQNRLEFYTKEDKIIVESDLFRDATALAYDDAHQTILFIKKHTDNASICSFEMSTQKHKVLVTGKDIGGFTIDPIRAVLYWTDIAERSIFWISFKQGYKETDNKNLLIKMEDEIPRAIAVDICKGYVYWTNTNSTKPTIERVRFDGTEKEVLVDESINDPVSLAIDQQTLKMFWADNTRNKKYRIFSTELDGKNKTELISGDSGTDFKPNALTVSKDLIYLIDEGTHAVWKHSKFLITESLKNILHFTEAPSGIVARYTTEEQIHGKVECKDVMTALLNDKIICVHGEKANATSCTCAPGYIGERCDVSVCQNYCNHGTCSVSDEGEPSCGCESGYSGARCDINMCFNYCLNNGVCYFTEENEPLCQCSLNYRGSRCEAIKNDTVCTTFSSGAKNFTTPISAHNNFTLADLLNRRHIVTKVTVNVQIESN
ncbi:protein cueball isoform X2 [Helicoverpa armigera]|uniref:protein cueball isoform X2 n=1 Tax=Helicoverpa armigera TaxID=29058 RepID=UPI00308297FF